VVGRPLLPPRAARGLVLRERLLEDSAAFLLSPLMVISFKTIGYAGVVLFFAPLRMFHESHRRYWSCAARSSG